VQTRTRGRRTFLIRFLDPKYKMETHYCFKGVFRRYKVFGGPDVTVFEIENWADDFADHANARKADGLPRRRITCDQELVGKTDADTVTVTENVGR
jgi:hypothetical protein